MQAKTIEECDSNISFERERERSACKSIPFSANKLDVKMAPSVGRQQVRYSPLDGLEGPERTTSAADNQLPPRLQSAPMACICSLCNCGEHKCSDFEGWWPTTNANQSMKEHDGLPAASLGQLELGQQHTCNYRLQTLDERYLTQPSRTASRDSDEAQRQKPRQERNASHNVGVDSECDLVGVGVGATKQNGQYANDLGPFASATNDATDQELIRVLVSKPQVASKPRDNIIFEGDMDLKTTFELSYEALARKRLEHWRRHQDLLAGRSPAPLQADPAAPGCTTNGHQVSAAELLSTEGLGADRGGGGGGGEAGWRQSKGEACDAVKRSKGGKKQAEKSLSPFKGAAGGNDGCGSCRDGGGTNVAAEGKNLATSVTQPPRQPLPNPPPMSRVNGRAVSSQEQYIDPDLSPIICYDANLNRLERVGLRKRSKYRPSTSLRPGGRDFFGATAGTKGENESGAKSVHGLEAKTTGRSPQASPMGPDRHGAAAGASSEILNRDENDCGRKHHLGHVNRVDHIKQMNLVEYSDPYNKELCSRGTLSDGDKTEQQTLQTTRLPPQKTDNATTKAELKTFANNVASNDAFHLSTTTLQEAATADKRLAAEEEAEAMAELQRLGVVDGGQEEQMHMQPTSRQSNGLSKQATTASTPEEATKMTAVKTNNILGSSPNYDEQALGRQLRQERVGQNQSFYLSENEYPETRSMLKNQYNKIGGRETVELTKSNQVQPLKTSPKLLDTSARLEHRNKNLFRESPDFILTTGGGFVRDNKQTNKSHDSKIVVTSGEKGFQQHVLTDQGNTDSSQPLHFSHQLITSPCRILELDNDFEFVGSSLGHKYFVEKFMKESIVDLD